MVIHRYPRISMDVDEYQWIAKYLRRDDLTVECFPVRRCRDEYVTSLRRVANALAQAGK